MDKKVLLFNFDDRKRPAVADTSSESSEEEKAEDAGEYVRSQETSKIMQKYGLSSGGNPPTQVG